MDTAAFSGNLERIHLLAVPLATSFWCLIQGDFLMACGCVDAHVVLWRLAGKPRSLDITV